MRRKPHEASTPKADVMPETELDLVAEELAAMEAEDAARAEAERASGAAVAEPVSEAVGLLEREVVEWKDRALRASADFDNYRKRALREHGEASGRGQAEAFAKIIDVIDDLARVAHLDPAQTSAESLHEGMLAIERKFIKTLEVAGLERIDPLGQRFDPRTQEAVTMQPAAGPDADQTVGAVFQHGYVYKGLLLRPARVAVLQWSGEASA